MDPNRLTEKAVEVLRQAQGLTRRRGQALLEVEHLAVALLAQAGRGRRARGGGRPPGGGRVTPFEEVVA